MRQEITVPRLGWSMEQGVFLGWLKRPGEAVRAGEPLYTLEGDKSTEEIAALETGILEIPTNSPREGDTVPVGAVLGYLISTGAPMASPVAAGGATNVSPATVPATAVDAASGRRRFSRVPHAAITPRARKTAARLGVDLGRVQGTGRNGRIRERDVLALAEKKPQPAARSRKALAERLRQSKENTVAVTLTATADATNLVNLRQQFKVGDNEMVPTVTDLFVRLVARCLQLHPHLNARWQEDQLVILSDIHMGIAVDAGQELLVAVLRDVARKSLREIARQSRDLIEQARSHRLRAADMEGGTFTISNLGALGVDSFTPVINWPEIAILGIGRIRQQPLVVEGRIVAREQITLSLTSDHRAVDGAPAARFLLSLCKAVENPAPYLID